MRSTRQTRPKIDAIFHAALEIRDRGERDIFLDSSCGTDADLRRRVESLLAADGVADEFFRTAEVVRGQELTDLAPPPQAAAAEEGGMMIGRYKLLQKIGEGGFGTVWMAEQTEPVKRKVALKIIKLGMDTREVIARFEAERQALAMMDHPNIAKVLDGGATEGGRPFFVMELVRGVPITDYCDEYSLSTRERLELFVDICHAVQHAHQKGIIHRDLKPSNVMVTMHDDKPVPKVIDFGVAKATQADLTDKTLYTRYEQFIGTPAYMSPEQAQMSGLDIDTRSDIYSLGVLLYELLTGNTPFDSKELVGAGFDEIRRVIREEDPPKPSTRVNTLGEEALTDLARHRKAHPEKLEGLLRGDLDWIIMMALEKDRTRRYETAIGLAKDIRHHLADEPVTAAAPGAGYRLAKYVRRHRNALITSAAFASVVTVAGVSLTANWIEAKDSRVIADQAKIKERDALIKAQRAELDARYAQDALETAEAEKAALATAKREADLRLKGRKLNRKNVGQKEWADVREVLELFLENPGADGYEKRVSYDGIKLAAVCLMMGDRDAYEVTCAEMVEGLAEFSDLEYLAHTVRAYFAVPRASDDPVAQRLRALAPQIDLNLDGWSELGTSVAEYRMGNYQEARDLLSKIIRIGNLKLQASVRPYLAMACHRLGDDAEAQRFLRGAEESITRLEEADVDIFWHERLLSRLALEEAKQLVEGTG